MPKVILQIVALVALVGCISACNDKTGARNADADANAQDAANLADASVDGDASVQTALVDAGTDDTAMPSISNEELSLRMRHLLEAIAQNNADLANDVLFPRDAYLTAKDSTDPSKAWDKRVAGAFRTAIERTHAHTKGAPMAKFVSFELGKTITQIRPKKKDFKLPLWRVKHSNLTFTIDGKTHHLHIAEMVSWRGNWYVLRLR
ncbi:MAG: hypothetical protein FWD69_15795 [Polyangiaceae bacterium]|nr:hypothetical protein [Polyangiaceae bacterium]